MIDPLRCHGERDENLTTPNYSGFVGLTIVTRPNVDELAIGVELHVGIGQLDCGNGTAGLVDFAGRIQLAHG